MAYADDPVPLHPTSDPIDFDLSEVDIAVALVTGRIATRVRLVGLIEPDQVAPIALARAQAAELEFEVDRTPTSTVLIIGPDRARP